MLGEIGAGQIPEVLALNKWDLADEDTRARILRRHPDGMAVSGLTGEGVPDLLRRVEERIPTPPVEVELLIPYERADLVSMLYRQADVVRTEDTEKGTEMVARVSEAELARLGDFIRRPAVRRGLAGDAN